MKTIFGDVKRHCKMICIFLASFVAVVLAYQWGHSYLESNSQSYYDNEPASNLTIQTFDDQKFVLVSQKTKKGYIYYGQDYITTFSEHSLFTGKLKKPRSIGKEEFYKVTSYDLNHLGKKVEFDLYRLLGKDNKFRTFSNLPGSKGYFNGNDYLSLHLQKIDRDDYENLKDPNNKRILFTAKGEIIQDDVESKIKEIKDQPSVYQRKINWSRGGINDQIEKVLYEKHLTILLDGILGDLEDNTKVDVSGTNFAHLYPEVAKNMKYIEKLYFRPKQYNEREWFDKIIHWFAPEGQDVMELYATDETTGEKTQIHSYDEFVAWIKAHPKN